MTTLGFRVLWLSVPPFGASSDTSSAQLERLSNWLLEREYCMVSTSTNIRLAISHPHPCTSRAIRTCVQNKVSTMQSRECCSPKRWVVFPSSCLFLTDFQGFQVLWFYSSHSSSADDVYVVCKAILIVNCTIICRPPFAPSASTLPYELAPRRSLRSVGAALNLFLNCAKDIHLVYCARNHLVAR